MWCFVNKKVTSLNSLAPGRVQRNFKKVIFQLILLIDGWSISCKIVLKWMPMDHTDGKSTLVQVMAWCRQATSHYLSQCWPRSLLPFGVTRPQWVNLINPSATVELIMLVTAEESFPPYKCLPNPKGLKESCNIHNVSIRTTPLWCQYWSGAPQRIATWLIFILPGLHRADSVSLGPGNGSKNTCIAKLQELHHIPTPELLENIQHWQEMAVLLIHSGCGPLH